MKKLFAATVSIAALYGAPAFAADMPMKAPVYRAAAAGYSWTGFYIGATAGYGWGDTFQFDNGAQSGDHNWAGFVGGGTAGFSWQSGAWVLGLETDISHADVKASWGTAPDWGCIDPHECSNKIDWFGTTRARVGYAFDRVMPYVTVGVAYGRVHGQYGLGCADACATSTETGLTWGGGVEWAFASNWSAKAEYLRVDLGTVDLQLGSATAGLLGIGKTELNVARAGLNYKFGGM